MGRVADAEAAVDRAIRRSVGAFHDADWKGRYELREAEAHALSELVLALRAALEAVAAVLAGDEQAVVKVAGAQQVLIDAGLS